MGANSQFWKQYKQYWTFISLLVWLLENLDSTEVFDDGYDPKVRHDQYYEELHWEASTVVLISICSSSAEFSIVPIDFNWRAFGY